MANSSGRSVTTDYYAVLGVRRDANADEIKMAYRRLARRLDPDVNPDPVARERFKEITQAHEVLSDPGKRQMHDLGGDPFAAVGGYFSQVRREPSRNDGYAPGRWESDRERWPPHPPDGVWNQSWDQAPYSASIGEQPPSFSHDWRLPPAVKPYRPRPFPVAVVLMCVMLALAVLVATWVVTHRPGLQATPVTTTKPIWAPPYPSGRAPRLHNRDLTLSFLEEHAPAVILGRHGGFVEADGLGERFRDARAANGREMLEPAHYAV